jgi:metallo-beta-lactamase family protein
MADTQATLRLFKAVGYDREIDVATGIHATFLDAGHILGSAIIRVRITDGNAPEKIIVFSGDLGRHDTPIIRDPTTVSDADYLLVESTYGGREHEPHAEAVRVLAETVQLVAQSNGVLLVPSFAIGRTQEVVWQLDRLLDEKKIPSLPLYLDSPMASKPPRSIDGTASTTTSPCASCWQGARTRSTIRSSRSRTTSRAHERSARRLART